ncbi:DUF6332 family protein [Streptomyces sp. NPDC047973]|uniref:DUF6332 family protein n=1 Tax=Streptomyces sp. NPDC047973 TaxID=3155383 RepID=UPI00341D0B33
MDQGRESRWEKDAMTVEIIFALVTAAALALAVFAPAWAFAHVLQVNGPVRHGVLTGGAALGASAGLWRLIRVLLRFDAQRRQGH